MSMDNNENVTMQMGEVYINVDLVQTITPKTFGNEKYTEVDMLHNRCNVTETPEEIMAIIRNENRKIRNH